MLGVAIGTTNQPHADESGDMLASSRVPDVDVYADVTALKLSHVFRTELSSLEVTDSRTQEGLQRHSDMSNMVVVTENKALRHIPARTGPLVLDGSGRSLTSSIKNQEMHVFWVKRVFIMYSTKLQQ